jgi:hypothetical protein
MATQAAPAPAAADAPPAKGGSKLIIIGAVAGLALGGAVGAFVLGPKMSPAAPAAAAEHAPAGGGEHGEGGASAVSVHAIENLVVNPANTNGSRFLLVTTAIIVKDEAALEEVSGPRRRECATGSSTCSAASPSRNSATRAGAKASRATSPPRSARSSRKAR